jgi:hypothetical protein
VAVMQRIAPTRTFPLHVDIICCGGKG